MGLQKRWAKTWSVEGVREKGVPRGARIFLLPLSKNSLRIIVKNDAFSNSADFFLPGFGHFFCRKWLGYCMALALMCVLGRLQFTLPMFLFQLFWEVKIKRRARNWFKINSAQRKIFHSAAKQLVQIASSKMFDPSDKKLIFWSKKGWIYGWRSWRSYAENLHRWRALGVPCRLAILWSKFFSGPYMWACNIGFLGS